LRAVKMIAIRQASSVNPKYLDAQRYGFGEAGRGISAVEQFV